jgi:hypothetical protein
LVDWPAETYQLPMSDAAVIAHAEVFNEVRERARHEIRRMSNVADQEAWLEAFRLILAPIWIGLDGATTLRPTIVVNGQNGTVGAEKPRRAAGWLSRLLGG